MNLEEKAVRFDQLILEIGLQILRFFAPGTADLSITEMLLVEIVGHRGSATVTELATTLALPLTTLASIVTRMVRRGYLERQRTEEDRRVVLVSLSRRGRAFYEQHRRDHTNMAIGFLSILPEEEQTQVVAVLDKVLTVLSANAEKSAKRSKVRSAKTRS